MNAPLVRELASVPDPWAAARRFAGLPHLLFLDSAVFHPERGRYSFLSADPVQWWSSITRDPFHILRDEVRQFSAPLLPQLPPFQGGLAGVFGYGLQHATERVPRPKIDEFRIPDLGVGIYDWVIAWDHLTRRCWVFSTGYPDGSGIERRARERLQLVLERLEAPPPAWPSSNPVGRTIRSLAPQFPLPGFPGVTSNFDRAGYLSAVTRAIEYIRAGDCFQINLSQRLLAPLAEHPLALYGRLRERNPAPFAGYLDLGEFAVASASPERFLRAEAGEVETRPIKGTRPRGSNPAEERQRVEELASSAKDRAENVMIVDLLRNDLGRVCQFGSVQVPRVCEIETFRHVHHLVSEVRGRLRDDQTPLDLLRACFPGGSVTGAPKVRAMEIIAELEPTARGPYCGCLGYVGFNGTMDTNILIRTFTAGRGYVQFPVGGGIVADSDPEREYEETLHKARGMLQSLE